MGEMNNCNNPYAAYSCSGGRRDRDHSAATFKRAWKRVYLIMHGGDVAAINARLARAGAARGPGGRGDASRARDRVRVGADDRRRAEHLRAAPAGLLARPPVGRLGRHELLLALPELHRLDRFYKDFAVGKRKPFAIAEWAIWGADAPGFADRLFDWIASHKRVKMVQYNQGAEAGGIFRLGNYPGSARVVRGRLAHPRYLGLRARAAVVSAERRGDHAPVRRRGGLSRSRPASVSEAKMPRRSSEHMARQARPSSSSRATTREHRALRGVDRLGELLHADLALRTLAEPIEHLVLDRREVVLAA